MPAKCDSVERVPSHDQVMHQLEPLLSPKDLANFLDLPVATIYAWRYRRQGPLGFRVGRHLRYRQSDVREWIQSELKTARGRE